MSGDWLGDLSEDDRVALVELSVAGVGEGDFSDDHGVPADLLELAEVLEYEADAPPVSEAEAQARAEAVRGA